MAQLFRAMREDPGQRPEIGPSARALGVRPGIDVPVVSPSAIVVPGQGGLSVSPDDPLTLPYFRRPPALQGTGRDPVWGISAAELGPALCYRPDLAHPGHGFVEPARPMALGDYQRALALTQDRWRKVGSWPDQGSTSDAVS